MNDNKNEAYTPADDDNQGVIQLMAQGEEATAGISQAEYMNPVTAQGPEPEKAEVNDSNDGIATNDTEQVEEVEDGKVNVENE